MRREVGLSQTQVAVRLRITQSAWAKIEKGIVPLNALQEAEFCKLVGVLVSEMLARVEQIIAEFEAGGGVILYQRVPPKLSDAGSNLLLGAALVGLLGLFWPDDQ